MAQSMVVRGLRPNNVRCIAELPRFDFRRREGGNRHRRIHQALFAPAGGDDDLLKRTRRRGLALCPDRVTGPNQCRKSQKLGSRYNRSVTAIHDSPRNEALKTPFVPCF